MLPPHVLRRFLEGRLPETLDLLRQMVDINSWTDNPAGVNRLGLFTAECFAPLGFAAERVASTNPAWGDHLVLPRVGTGSQTVAMVSHLDTVFPPEEEARNNFRWQPEGDRIYGPGTHDIKGGTMMMWLVLAALRELAPAEFAATTWKLFLNSSEETYSPDFGEVVRQRCDPRQTLAALVFEAEGRQDGTPQLVAARKGRGTWRITVRGRAAHAGSRHAQGANAVVQLGATLQRVAVLTDYARGLTFNAARCTGGTGLNRVPHEAVAEGEFRAFTPGVFAQARADLLALAGSGSERSSADGFPCVVEAEVLTETRPWPLNRGTNKLIAIWQSAASVLGQKLGAEQRGGLSDGNLLWDFVRTIDGLGPWGDHDHCSERSADGSKLPEFVEVSTFASKAALNTQAILELLQLGDSI
jgi:glutamate carboxypeptidase